MVLTDDFHHWQFGAADKQGDRTFRTSDRIGIAISGGREAGYRAYTRKQRIQHGDWRVDVETEDGRVLGRVSFRVEEGGEGKPELETITY